MAIANPNDLFGIQAHITGAVVNHDKIVACSIHFCESQHAFVYHNLAVKSTRGVALIEFGANFSAVFGRIAIYVACVVIFGATQAVADNLNGLILEQINKMPSGGRYSVSHFAAIRLQSAAHFESGKFFVIPTAPYPSFCSGATYIVFIKAIEALRDRGRLQLDFATLDQLIIRDQHDGQGIWGRWNANGPGTARLFHELRIGRNFVDFEQAHPGDFMKIFWNNNVGRRESGHSVIFLGTVNRPDGEYVRFWSSNIPRGYGEKEVPRTKIAYAIFSRLEAPENLSRIHTVPETDSYLASLLRKKSSFAEATRMCGI
jgi:hypothetical protein